MQKTFIGILVIAVVVVLFAVRNAQEVQIDFWLWELDSNLSLLVFLSVTFGALTSFLLSLPYRARKNKAIKERDERIEFLNNEILLRNQEAEKSDETIKEESESLGA